MKQGVKDRFLRIGAENLRSVFPAWLPRKIKTAVFSESRILMLGSHASRLGMLIRDQYLLRVISTVRHRHGGRRQGED